MPIKLKSTGGGSVTLDVPSTGTDFTLTLPANNATLLSSNGSSLSNTTFSGNTAISGASSYLNINGINVSPYSGMMKNRIINGDFRIDQRFAGAGNNNISGLQYVVDRWCHSCSGAGKLRFQQNNTNGPGSSATQTATGFPNYFGANTVSANTVNAGDYWAMLQLIEGFNSADLSWGTANAQPVTLSFWVYSSIAGTHGGSIMSSNASRTYPFTYTINTANTWQYQTVTIPGDTAAGGTGNWYANNGIGMYVLYSLGYGSNYQGTNNTWNSGSVQAPTGAVNVVSNANGSFYLTGVQLEKGSQATAFDFRHYTTELQLCQRYYFRAAAYSSTDAFAMGVSYNSTSYYMSYQLRQSMRTTCVVNSSRAGALTLIAAGNAYQSTAVNYTLSTLNAVEVYCTAASTPTPGYGGFVRFTANTDWVDFSSELSTQN